MILIFRIKAYNDNKKRYWYNNKGHQKKVIGSTARDYQIYTAVRSSTSTAVVVVDRELFTFYSVRRSSNLKAASQTVLCCCFRTDLELQSHLVDKPLKFQLLL